MRYKRRKSTELVDFIDVIDLVDFIDVIDFKELTDTIDSDDLNETRRFANGRILQRLVGLEAGNGRGEGLLRAYEVVPKGRSVWNDQPDPQSFARELGHAAEARVKPTYVEIGKQALDQVSIKYKQRIDVFSESWSGDKADCEAADQDEPQSKVVKRPGEIPCCRYMLLINGSHCNAPVSYSNAPPPINQV